MVETTNRNGIFVADFPSERARLRKPKVMRFGRRAAAYDAGLLGHKFAMLLVAQADRLARQAASPAANGFLRGLRDSTSFELRGAQNRQAGFRQADRP